MTKELQNAKLNTENNPTMNYAEFYKSLLQDITKKYGDFDAETLTGVIGFTGGGPVSLFTNANKNICVTCELALNENQIISKEGLNYEFISIDFQDLDWCQSVFTALGDYSLENALGDGHTIDIAGLEEAGPSIIRLTLIYQTVLENKQYGVYMVSEA